MCTRWDLLGYIYIYIFGKKRSIVVPLFKAHLPHSSIKTRTKYTYLLLTPPWSLSSAAIRCHNTSHHGLSHKHLNSFGYKQSSPAITRWGLYFLSTILWNGYAILRSSSGIGYMVKKLCSLGRRKFQKRREGAGDGTIISLWISSPNWTEFIVNACQWLT